MFFFFTYPFDNSTNDHWWPLTTMKHHETFIPTKCGLQQCYLANKQSHQTKHTPIESQKTHNTVIGDKSVWNHHTSLKAYRTPPTTSNNNGIALMQKTNCNYLLTKHQEPLFLCPKTHHTHTHWKNKKTQITTLKPFARHAKVTGYLPWRFGRKRGCDEDLRLGHHWWHGQRCHGHRGEGRSEDGGRVVDHRRRGGRIGRFFGEMFGLFFFFFLGGGGLRIWGIAFVYCLLFAGVEWIEDMVVGFVLCPAASWFCGVFPLDRCSASSGHSLQAFLPVCVCVYVRVFTVGFCWSLLYLLLIDRAGWLPLVDLQAMQKHDKQRQANGWGGFRSTKCSVWRLVSIVFFFFNID